MVFTCWQKPSLCRPPSTSTNAFRKGTTMMRVAAALAFHFTATTVTSSSLTHVVTAWDDRNQNNHNKIAGRPIEEVRLTQRNGNSGTPRRLLREPPEQEQRSLQSASGLCNLGGDIARQEFQCTLDEYCDTIRTYVADAPLLGKDVTCTGNLAASYTVLEQGYVCLDNPGITTGLFQNFPYDRICYNIFLRSDYNGFRALPIYARFDFLEGLTFLLEETYQTCETNPADICTCSIKLEDRDCQACSVCNDGRLIGDHYSFAVDCTNLADGLVRTCDAIGWGEFYQQVEASLPLRAATTSNGSSTTTTNDPTTITATGPVAATPKSSDGQRLSSAAVGGIIGAVVAVLLAGLFTLVLCCVVRSKQNRRRGRDKNDTTSAEAPGGDGRPTTPRHDGQQNPSAQRPSTPPPPSSLVPMAQVLLVDHGTMDNDPAADSAPMYKDQMRLAVRGRMAA
jgi:hypothetical protein